MRILVLSSLGRNTGCHLRGRYLADALRRQGRQVRYPLPPPGLPLMLDLPLSFLTNLVTALTARFDLAVAIKPYPNTLIPLLLRKLLTPSVRIVADIDDMDHGYRTGPLPRLLRLLQRPLPRLCDFVTCHTDTLAAWIPREYGVDPRRIRRLDQGVDTSLFHPLPEDQRLTVRRKVLRRFGLPDTTLLVHTAHLNVASDLDHILQAFRTVAEHQPEPVLLVAGGGPLLGTYRRMAGHLGLSHRVRFTGPLRPEEAADCIAAADACLVYYKNKPVNLYRASMKLREALAMARPVIANDVGDLKSFADVTYPAGTGPQAYAEGITRFLEHGPDGRERRGAERVRQRCDWNRIAAAFLADLQP